MSEWVDVIGIDELEPGDATAVVIGKFRLAIYDAIDGLYVTQALCSHAGAPLCDGYFDGHVIECPLHQGGFDIRTGKALYPPVTVALKTYPVRVINQRVEVKL